jgi:hypothetical protein
MKNSIQRALFVAVVITVILLILLSLTVYLQRDQISSTNRIEYYKFYLEAFKVIAIGFGVAVLGILVPAVLTQARNSFERLKDSRNAYSEAKTGVDYLPIRLSALNLKEAGALVQAVHVRKHQAELYDELGQWLERRYNEGDDRRDPVKWGDKMYDRLFAIRVILERHADRWDQMTPADRLNLLLEIQPSEKET